MAVEATIDNTLLMQECEYCDAPHSKFLCNDCGEACYCSRLCQQLDWKHHCEECKLLQNVGGIENVCENCFKNSATFTCKGCNVASYCSKKCQIADWRKYHRSECCNIDVLLSENEFKKDDDELSETAVYCCDHCGHGCATHRCKDCGIAIYCNEECMLEDAEHHAKECGALIEQTFDDEKLRRREGRLGRSREKLRRFKQETREERRALKEKKRRGTLTREERRRRRQLKRRKRKLKRRKRRRKRRVKKRRKRLKKRQRRGGGFSTREPFPPGTGPEPRGREPFSPEVGPEPEPGVAGGPEEPGRFDEDEDEVPGAGREEFEGEGEEGGIPPTAAEGEDDLTPPPTVQRRRGVLGKLKGAVRGARRGFRGEEQPV